MNPHFYGADGFGAREFLIVNPRYLPDSSIMELPEPLPLECHQFQVENPSLILCDDLNTSIWAKKRGFDWFADSINKPAWRIWIRFAIGVAHASS